MKISRLVVAFAALLPAAFMTTVSTDANACGMSVRMDPTPQRPTPVQEIARAEKALEGGQTLAAVQAVLGTFPGIRSVTPTSGSNPLETRALRVFAQAIVRSDGTVDEKKARVASANGIEWTQKTNLEWAVQSLREIDATRPNDPTVQANLGEALSKTEAGKKEALKILQGLAQKDLMGSPHAYAALAKLRTESGDSAGAEAAIKRCEEMSKTPAICKTPSAPSTKPVVAAKA